MKQCKKCKLNLPLDQFYNAKGGKMGKRGHCINCDKEKNNHYNNNNRIYNKESISKSHKKYYELNKVSIRKKHALYQSHRYKTDPLFRVRINLSGRINKAVKNGSKSQKTLDLLGCTLEFFKQYLESKFLPGMTWENYNLYGWHIDHIKPCSLFDLTDPEQQKLCFHYTNLQPLWAKDNLSKNNKY
jgi:hypothetical protein